MKSDEDDDLQKSRTMRLTNRFWGRFTQLAQIKGMTRTALFIQLVEDEIERDDTSQV